MLVVVTFSMRQCASYFECSDSDFDIFHLNQILSHLEINNCGNVSYNWKEMISEFDKVSENLRFWCTCLRSK